MPKFIKIDLLNNMEKIMKCNTESYQSDFELDREMLVSAAANAGNVFLRDRTYLWMSRACGTWCLKERDVFLKPTSAHHTWEFYIDSAGQRILAYAIEVTGREGETVIGNLYPLNYQKHVEVVKEQSLPASCRKLVCEKGELLINSGEHFRKEDKDIFGEPLYSEYVPDDKGALEMILYRERSKRNRMQDGRIEDYIRKLAA